MTTETKTCNKCHKEFPLGRFGRDKKNSDGHSNTCLDCRNLASRRAAVLRRYSGPPAGPEWMMD